MDEPEPKRYGRGLFLATVAGGLSSLAWGKPVWSASPPRSRRRRRSSRSSRRAAGGSTRSSGSMPTFDPATWRLEIGGLVEQAARRSATTSCARCRARRRCPTSTASPAGRCTNVHWTGVRIATSSRRRSRRPRRTAAVRLGREAVRRLPDDGAGAAPRRDARVRDGREAARARARRAGAARDPRDVRLQERQVADARSTSCRRRSTGTGSTSATTATRGSAARTATTS